MSLAPYPISASRDSQFSLVLGGPLFQLLCRAHLADGALGLVHRRIAFAILMTWLPVTALSGLEGSLLGDGNRMPLGADIGFHLRFLIVVPLLILAELIVHRRMLPIID